MTTATWSTVLDHSSDAGFRAWGSELATKFAACGLVQTADTGQINWLTVTRPGISTIGGYEIWRLADSTIYMKVEYGTNTTVGFPSLFVTFGTGSNGAGTLTGQTSTRTAVTISSGSAIAGSTAVARVSYLCVTASFIGLCWKIAWASLSVNSLAFFSMQKMVDSAGAPITTGFVAHYRSISGAVPTGLGRYESVRIIATAVDYGISSNMTVIPNDITSSVVGSDNQIFLHFAPSPRVIPLRDCFSVFNTELPLATTFTATPVGATSHTFLSLGGTVGFWGNSTSDDVGLAMLWE